MSSAWSGGGLIPPPPGVTPNFVNPPDQLTTNIAVHTVFLTFSTFAVVVRLYTRIIISRMKLGTDDYLAIFGYLSTVAFSVLLFKAYALGIGRHLWDVPPPWFVPALKWQTISSWVYITAGTLVKLSILFLYLRVFSLEQKTRILVISAIVVLTLTNFGFLLGDVFFCIPVAKAWNAALPGHCTSPAALAWFTGVWSVVVDIFILAVPIPLVWNLNIGSGRRIRLASVFGLGIFAVVASIVRLGMTSFLQSSADATYNISKVALWAVIEINVGLMCSCLLLLPGFLRHHLPESTKSFIRSFIITRSKNKSNPNSSQLGGWPGYMHRVSSDSQNLVAIKGGNHIVQTNTFTLESVRVDRKGHTGEVPSTFNTQAGSCSYVRETTRTGSHLREEWARN
ncbi:hypothetical protein F5Y19DRAFT_486046 [Xylariaceae sp. FL1651]|nr:hypothetical protein F5Y19DRAFT_486046 [Xylariaceae sp. FL1651]